MVFCFCFNVGFFFFFFFRAKGSICHCASPPARPHRYQPLPLSRPSRDERPSAGAHACPRPPRGGVGGAEGPPRPGATPVPGRFPRRGPEPPPGGGVTCGPAAGGNGVAVAAGTPPPPGHARSGHRGCSAGVCATEGRGEAEIFVSHFPRELRARGLLCSLFIWIVIFSFFNYYFVFFTLVEIPAHGEDLLEDRART